MPREGAETDESAKSRAAAYRIQPILPTFVLFALIGGRDKRCCFLEPACIAHTDRAGPGVGRFEPVLQHDFRFLRPAGGRLWAARVRPHATISVMKLFFDDVGFDGQLQRSVG